MDPLWENRILQTRRQFFGRAATGIGVAALANLLDPRLALAGTRETPAGLTGGETDSASLLRPALPHFAPKAKRVIYMFQSGAPSQLDLFDYKPAMHELFDSDVPDSVFMGQRLTTMTSGQDRFPVAPSIFRFAPAWARGSATVSAAKMRICPDSSF